MLTKSMWESINDYNLVEYHSLWFYDYELTPNEKAIMIILYAILTPIALCVDILLFPIEIIFILLRNKIAKEVKNNGK